MPIKRFAIFVFIACLPLWGKSQTAKDSAAVNLYPIKQLRADFVYFKTALETAHPSLYRYQPKDTVDALFLRSLEKIDHPMGDIEFWLLLERMVAKIGSAHTDVVPGEAFTKQLASKPHNFLPFSIYIRDNSIFIKSYFGPRDSSFVIGEEILAINHEPAFDVLRKLRMLLPGDGYSQAFRDFKLERNAFRGNYNLIYGELPEYAITYRGAQGVNTKLVKPITVQPQAVADRGKDERYVGGTHSGALPGAPDSLKHKLFYPADIPSTAILSIAEFTYDDYFSYHKKVFKEIQQRNIANLVIDLRGNPGGLDLVCIDLMKYVMDSRFQYTKSTESVVNVAEMQKLAKYVAGTKPAFIDFSTFGRSLIKSNEIENEMQHGMGKFKGKVYILTDHGTFSAASLMATAIKEQRLQCTLIGEETGGGRAGCDGGQGVSILLPYTHFELKLPLAWATSMTSQPNYGDGLKPDITFIPNVWDIYYQLAKKTDPFMRIIKSTIIGQK